MTYVQKSAAARTTLVAVAGLSASRRFFSSAASSFARKACIALGYDTSAWVEYLMPTMFALPIGVLVSPFGGSCFPAFAGRFGSACQ